MSDDFNKLKPFRFWCQTVLPLVYDNSLSYYELLCKVVDYLNKTMEDVNAVIDLTETFTEEQAEAYADFTADINATVASLTASFNTLHDFVDNYFDNLDVQQEINNKLDVMATDGTLTNMVTPVAATMIPTLVSQWLQDNITPTTPAVDKTLTITDAAADAWETGYRLAWFGDSYTWTDGSMYAVVGSYAGTLVANENYLYTARVKGTIDEIIGVRAFASVPDGFFILLWSQGTYVGFFTYGIINSTPAYYYLDPAGNQISRPEHDEYAIDWRKNLAYPSYDWTMRRAKLAADVTGLKEDLTKLETAVEIKTQSSPQYQSGYIRDDGTFGNSNNNCRTTVISLGSGNLIATPKQGYTIKIAEYSSNTTSAFIRIISPATPLPVKFTAISSNYYAIQIGSAHGSSVTPSNIPTDAVVLSFISYTDPTLTIDGKAADAKASGDKITGTQSNLGYWHQQIVTPENTSHLSTVDILNVNIPAGKIFCVLFEMNWAFHPQYYVFYKNGTSERIYINVSSTYISYTFKATAQDDIIGIGTTLAGTTSPERIITTTIIIDDSASWLFNYGKRTPHFIREPEGLLCFKEGRSRFDIDTIHQSIAVYDNQVWEFGEGKAAYNNVQYTLDNGHANCCNWGNVLHGDYPYLYCPKMTDKTINVFSFDGTAFTLVNTITVQINASGNLNAYIDEQNGFIYGFVSDTNLIYFVCDLTGNLLESKTLRFKLPTIQNMCLHDGVLYIVSGFGTTASPNYISKISTDGTLLGKYLMTGFGEIEGIDFLDNKMILATYYKFYYDPEIVPETIYYGVTDQLKAT